MRFEFATANRILFGPGSIRDAGAIARDLGRRALLVTGRDTARAAPLLALLEPEKIPATIYSCAGEPTLNSVTQGAELGRSARCDLVIAFGGGSAIDAAKAIAAMLTNDGDLLDYLEVIGRGKALARPGAPFIAIPTTAGTGSEVTRNAVLASPENKVKVSLRSPFLLPKVALIDPELTHHLPPSISASTGLDALTQLIEAFVSARANPMTDAFCRDGIPRVASSLRGVFHDGQNATARQDMALAALFSGLALANAGLGAVHGFAGPIGGMFDAPHGAVCAALLPHVMEFNLRALRQRQPHSDALHRCQQVAQLLTGNAHATAEEGVAWVRRLVADLQIPGLGAYGMRAQDASEVSGKAEKSSSMKGNPLALTRDELTAIFEAAL